MTWRTVILANEAKISLRMNHLVIIGEQTAKVPINEIAVLIVENPNIVLTGHIVNALAEAKITTVLCDSKHNPCSLLHSVYGHHRQSKQIKQQFHWCEERKGILWQKITQQKIKNQAELLTYYDKDGAEKVNELVANVLPHDTTNREGYAAKLYFHSLFGKAFYRGAEDEINWGLNYGYAIIHALFARQIVSKGLLTELGIHHSNEYNQYNLASDLLEVYRPVVDFFVVENVHDMFAKEQRRAIIAMLNSKILTRGGKHYLAQSIQIYIDSCVRFLQDETIDTIHFPTLMFQDY